jgi:phosphoglycolate phosphatase-like HAD superfamily hydrolase
VRPAILIDLDKTLVNVLDYVDYCKALEEVLHYLGRDVVAEVPATYWGRCAVKTMEVLVGLSGSEEWQRASDIVEKFEIIGAQKSTPMHGLNEFLGHVEKYSKKAVVTLLGRRAADAVFKLHNININIAICRDKRLRPKPHPDQVIEALKILNVPPEKAVMVGDSEWDEIAATSAGVKFIGITNHRDVHHFKNCVAVVDDLYGVIEVLRSLFEQETSY